MTRNEKIQKIQALLNEAASLSSELCDFAVEQRDYASERMFSALSSGNEEEYKLFYGPHTFNRDFATDLSTIANTLRGLMENQNLNKYL